MKISVAICTWNRARLLDQTLAEMRKLRIPEGVEWELLVVNNNCTDTTEEVTSKHASRLPLRGLFESKQGQANARNCAVAAATGDLLLWTDDDVLVDPDWLSEYVAAAKRFPEATFFGGTVEPWFAVEPPRWIRRHLAKISGAFAIRSFGLEVRPFSTKEMPYGANMGFRLAAVKAVPFNTDLGLNRSGAIRGEETELIERLLKSKHHGVWVGTASVKHYIPPERLTKRFVWEWHWGMGRYLARRRSFRDCEWLWGAPRWAIRKYCLARVQSLLLAPFQGARWVDAFREAAVCKGIIDETRAASLRPPLPDRPVPVKELVG